MRVCRALGWPPSEVLAWDVALYRAAITVLEDDASEARMNATHAKRWTRR